MAGPGDAHLRGNQSWMRVKKGYMKTKAQLFDGQALLAKVNGGKATVKFPNKKPVYSQGDAADSVFYIEKGRVKLAVVSKRGREAVIAILEPGDFFGEGCLAGQIKRMATATTMSDCIIVRIEKASTLQVLRANPAFSELFLAHMLSRNIRMEEDLVDQLFNSSEKRLARVLLLLANFGKEAKPDLVIAKISQETLAEMIGTTRSRVSYFMNRFRKLGFIEYNGELQVHSSLLNIVLHD
jgi:CRP/FNR family cyclic AMP-dependent transcriptional regulator